MPRRDGRFGCGVLHPTLKADRLANDLITLRREALDLAHAAGFAHPSLVPLDRFELLGEAFTSRSAREVFQYQPGWGLPPAAAAEAVTACMAAGGTS